MVAKVLVAGFGNTCRGQGRTGWVHPTHSAAHRVVYANRAAGNRVRTSGPGLLTELVWINVGALLRTATSDDLPEAVLGFFWIATPVLASDDRSKAPKHNGTHLFELVGSRAINMIRPSMSSKTRELRCSRMAWTTCPIDSRAHRRRSKLSEEEREDVCASRDPRVSWPDNRRLRTAFGQHRPVAFTSTSPAGSGHGLASPSN